MLKKILSIILVVYIGTAVKSDLISISTTFYTPQPVDAMTSPATAYNYLSVQICPGDVGGGNNLFQLNILLGRNPNWDPNQGIVLVQLSNCKDNFSSNCTFATNYVYSNHPVAISTIVYNLNKACPDLNNCAIYMRGLASGENIEWVPEITFTNNKNDSYYPYKSDAPFDGTNVINKAPDRLSKFWRTPRYITTKKDDIQYFALGNCAQSVPITSLIVSVASPVGIYTTLVQLYVCPKSIGNYTDCTQEGSGDWGNSQQAPFNAVTCTANQQKSLDNGVYIAVTARGPGDNGNEDNTYVVQAINAPS